MNDSPDGQTKEISVRYVVWVTLFVLALLVGLPFVGVFALNRWAGAASGVDFWGPIVAIMVSVTSMSVSGIFVFMSFRIDRGVRHETRETVREVLGKEMKLAFEEAGKQARKRFEDAKRVSDDALRGIEAEVRRTDEHIRNQLTQMGAQIDDTKQSIGRQCEEAGKAIQDRFDKQTQNLDEYFTGVHSLITALREQVLVSVLSAHPEDGQVTLSWTAGPDPHPDLLCWEYQQKQGDGEYGDWVQLPDDVATERAYVVDGLTNGEVYSFRVRVVSGDYAESNEATATPDRPDEPPDEQQDA